MKKLILPLVFGLLFSVCGLSACGNKEVTPSTPSRLETEIPTEDGYYTYIDEAGNEYVGEFVGGKYNGFGKMYYADGNYYEGTWVDGIREGSGRIFWNSGCVYIGEMKEDAMHGTGYMKWPMGDFYYGKWKYGNPNGFGTKHFLMDATAADDFARYNIYVGYMVDGQMEGYGEMNYSFGGVYRGNWHQGIRNGQGIYFWEETDDPEIPWLKFVGNFVDWISGEGTLYFKDGTILTGTFDGNNLPLSAEEFKA